LIVANAIFLYKKGTERSKTVPNTLITMFGLRTGSGVGRFLKKGAGGLSSGRSKGWLIFGPIEGVAYLRPIEGAYLRETAALPP
jgi:hypothetical protein